MTITLLALAAVLVGCGRAGDVPLGAAIGTADRLAVAAAPVVRGAEGGTAGGAEPLGDADPVTVVIEYLRLAYSVSDADAGATHLRAARYAVPGSPPAVVGVIVLDPPPSGRSRVATASDVRLLARDAADGRRAYRARLDTATGPHEGPYVADAAGTQRDVVVARQRDGRWLVAADTSASSQSVPDEH